MNYKLLSAILFAILVVLLLSGFSFSFKDDIDRDLPIRYEPKFGMRIAFVSLEKGNVYHNRISCSIERELLGLDDSEFSKITKYEAVVRGFKECPNCTNRAEEIDVESARDDIRYDISDVLDELYEIKNKL